MNDIQSLLNLPIETLIPLAAGYLSYRLAYTGKDATHSGVDTVLLSLVYAAISKIVFVAIPDVLITTIPLGFVIPLSSAAIWRKWGERGVFIILRKARISASDRHTTAWQSLIADDGMKATQLLVRRKDGVLIMCDNLHAFEDQRTGPFILGSDGSVAFYVTHQKGPSDNEWEDISLRDNPEWGINITYVPAAEIEFTQLRSS